MYLDMLTSNKPQPRDQTVNKSNPLSHLVCSLFILFILLYWAGRQTDDAQGTDMSQSGDRYVPVSLNLCAV